LIPDPHRERCPEVALELGVQVRKRLRELRGRAHRRRCGTSRLQDSRPQLAQTALAEG